MENYEQKYKKALERARDLHDNHALGMPFIYETCEDIFPELRESKDERIREAILHLVKSQKQQHFGIATYDNINWLDMISWIEKHGENNSWSEEDEKIYQSILDDTVTETQLDDKSITWLKSLKDRIQPQPKQEWSEEDEKMIETIFKDGNLKPSEQQWLVKLIKSQPHWKPSEEHFRALFFAIEYFKKKKNDTKYLESLYDGLKNL